jgi:hypothetical protein
MIMKKILFCITIVLSATASAQSNLETGLNVLYGRNTSTFGFIQSDGLKTGDMEYSGGNSFILGVDLTLNSRHCIIPEATYYEGGAYRNLNGSNLQWKLNYIGLGCAYGFKALAKDKITLIPGIAFGADYLMQGIQTIGNTRYDVKDYNALTSWNLRTNVFLNNRIKISDQLYFMFEYRFGIGLNQIEKNDADLNQKTRNLAHHFLLGLNFEL